MTPAHADFWFVLGCGFFFGFVAGAIYSRFCGRSKW